MTWLRSLIGSLFDVAGFRVSYGVRDGRHLMNHEPDLDPAPRTDPRPVRPALPSLATRPD